MVRKFLVRAPLLLLVFVLGGGRVLTVTPASAQDSAAGGAVPYVTERGDWRVYALSPDGTMVVASDVNAPMLCTFAVPSGEEIACADLEAADIALNPDDIAWAPDSSGIVFAENVFTYLADGDLWLLDARSGELTNLTDDGYAGILSFWDSESLDEPVYADVSPAWSPDGSMIAFSRTTIGGGSEETPSALWTLDLETGEAEELALFDPTYPGALIWGMAWSPDGGTIYATAGFAGYRTDDNGIWAFDAETGEAVHLAGPSEDHDLASPSVFAVSPAGDAMVISYPLYIQVSLLSDYSGYALLDLDTGDITPIEASGGTDSSNYAVGPNFAPDGETLVFGVRRLLQGDGQVVARDLATGEETLLATFPDGEAPYTADPHLPVLISDSGAVYVQALEAGYLLDLPEEMLDAPDDAAEPDSDDPAMPPDATPGELIVIGDRAAVLRSAPSRDAEILMVLQPGTELEPFGEPIEADGRTWLPVREPESAMLGYVREDFVLRHER